ncbi:MAG TPA: hypothetical protein VHR66_08960 [Gemmataceae bacterium]|nr:hypothetical protein [Gemmataceae bacterium]
MATTDTNTESDILHHLVFPFDEDLDAAAARSLLRIRFGREALKQINQLLRKNRRGEISAEERITLENYTRMGKFIDVLQAKARKALKNAGQPG